MSAVRSCSSLLGATGIRTRLRARWPWQRAYASASESARSLRRVRVAGIRVGPLSRVGRSNASACGSGGRCGQPVRRRVAPMDTREGTVAFPFAGEEAETWYRVTGELRPGDSAAPAPLVVLHGGPGATHDYLLSLADLADGRAVVHYDQLGNGRSTHFPDRGADFWTVDLFVRELHNLVDELGLRSGHHVLGQSWGGFLGQEYALTHPPGLRSLVLADTAASFPDFVTAANGLRAELPPGVEATLQRHEAAGTTDDPEYEAACLVFYGRHLCRLDPWPDEVVEAA